MYQVLARKWRPRSFEEVVGQPHVTRTLAHAIESGRLAHAYIFAGLRGTGKTTVARILAKCLNCGGGPTIKPCDACDSCREVAESRSLDVLEVDAASRTKVDQTRELLEVVNYAPARDRYRILIIDEAHMLSKASFNALLKTLEEPPPNVLFVMATTESQRILPTIHSRCQLFEFRRVAVDEVAAHLRTVCEAEKVEIPASALERIARAGEGSVRDSLSVLERALALCGSRIDEDDVLRMLGGVRAEVLGRLLRGLQARDAAAMLECLDGVVDEGHDLLHFQGELLAVLRDLLLLRTIPGRVELLVRSRAEAEVAQSAAEGLSREDLLRAFQVLADLEQPLKYSSQPRFLFEAALIRLASLGAVRPIEEVLASLGGAEGPEPAPPARPRGRADRAGEAKGPAHHAARPAPPPPARPEARPDPPRGAAGGPLADRIVAAVSERKPMLGEIVGRATGIAVRPGAVEMGFRPEQESMVGPLRRKDNLALLEELASAVVGERVRVLLTFEGSGAPAGSAEPPGRGAAGPPPPPASSEAALIETATGEPGVKKLLREFGAQIVDVRPMRTPAEPTEDGPGDLTDPMEDAR